MPDHEKANETRVDRMRKLLETGWIDRLEELRAEIPYKSVRDKIAGVIDVLTIDYIREQLTPYTTFTITIPADLKAEEFYELANKYRNGLVEFVEKGKEENINVR